MSWRSIGFFGEKISHNLVPDDHERRPGFSERYAKRVGFDLDFAFVTHEPQESLTKELAHLEALGVLKYDVTHPQFHRRGVLLGYGDVLLDYLEPYARAVRVRTRQNLQCDVSILDAAYRTWVDRYGRDHAERYFVAQMLMKDRSRAVQEEEE